MELTKNPKLQIQPCGHSCVPTCIAMALGIPVQEVIDDMVGAGMVLSEGTNEYHLIRYLMTKGIAVDTFMNQGLGLLDGHYFLSVASLNASGLMHSVFVYIVDCEPRIYDPNNGKHGKKFYRFGDWLVLPSVTITRLRDININWCI